MLTFKGDRSQWSFLWSRWHLSAAPRPGRTQEKWADEGFVEIWMREALRAITNLAVKTKWPCSRYTVLIGWTGSRGWTGNIQDDDRFLSKSIRLWPLWDISLTAYYCSFLYKKCLACIFNLFFGWRRCTGKMGTILDDSIYFGRGITRWSWPLIWTPIQLYTH